MEKRANDEENFPELPPEAEGGSSAIWRVEQAFEPSSIKGVKGATGSSQKGNAQSPRQDAKSGTGSTSRGGTKFFKFAPQQCPSIGNVNAIHVLFKIWPFKARHFKCPPNTIEPR